MLLPNRRLDVQRCDRQPACPAGGSLAANAMRFPDRRLEALWTQAAYSHFRVTDCMVLGGLLVGVAAVAVSSLAESGGDGRHRQGDVLIEVWYGATPGQGGCERLLCYALMSVSHPSWSSIYPTLRNRQWTTRDTSP